MRIVGLSAYYHDNAAALLVDGKIVAAAQEERFTRRKHDAGFPVHALAYCLAEARLDLQDIDYVAFYDKPFLKFERLLETYVAFAPRGLRSYQKSMPVWIKERLFQKDLLRAELERLAPRWTGGRASCSPNTISATRPRPIIHHHLTKRWYSPLTGSGNGAPPRLVWGATTR
jgi:predicted NodU family carbamoyl transferase